MQSIGIWGLREEAHKSWDHFLSNEVIYLAHSLERDFEVISLSEQYLDGHLWLELHFTIPDERQRELHFIVICEKVESSGRETLPIGETKPVLNTIRQGGNGPVFIQVPQFVQLPKGVIAKGCPSVVRLKPVYDVCHCGWKQTQPIPVGGVVVLEDRKLNPALLGPTEDPRLVEMGQLPSELIQRGTKATNKVPEQHRDDLWSVSDLDLKSMGRPFKIGLFEDGIWIETPLVDLPLKRLEVFVRPTGLHFYEYQSVDMGRQGAGSLAGIGQSSK